MKLIKMLAISALVTGGALATSGTASAASAEAAAPTCQSRVSSDYATGSVTCSGAPSAYRALVTCSNGSTVYGQWTSSGWSSATCPRPHGVTRVQAQYI